MSPYDPAKFESHCTQRTVMETGQVLQTTFTRLMLKHAAERPLAPALREKEYGIWQTITWSDLAKLVQSMACG